MPDERDRDPDCRARQSRPRDALGRPLPYGTTGVEPISDEPLPPVETISVARQLIDEGRPFAAHEIFEVRWKTGPPEERELWQGLAQICVGLTHHARGNQTGAERLVERGAGRLLRYSITDAHPYGLDLDAIVGCAESQVRGTR